MDDYIEMFEKDNLELNNNDLSDSDEYNIPQYYIFDSESEENIEDGDIEEKYIKKYNDKEYDNDSIVIILLLLIYISKNEM